MNKQEQKEMMDRIEAAEAALEAVDKELAYWKFIATKMQQEGGKWKSLAQKSKPLAQKSKP